MSAHPARPHFTSVITCKIQICIASAPQFHPTEMAKVDMDSTQHDIHSSAYRKLQVALPVLGAQPLGRGHRRPTWAGLAFDLSVHSHDRVTKETIPNSSIARQSNPTS